MGQTGGGREKGGGRGKSGGGEEEGAERRAGGGRGKSQGDRGRSGAGVRRGQADPLPQVPVPHAARVAVGTSRRTLC